VLVIECEAAGDSVIVRVKGGVDSSTAEVLTGQLSTALRQAETHPARLLIVDLQEVDFFGSAALNAMLDCHEEGKEAGTSVCLVADHDQVLRPIQVTELDRILDIYPTLSEALQRNAQ
jgi:anti-sigma B factor antagonist